MRVELQDVGKRYRYEWVLRNLTATFQGGKQYAISGPNGSGKSTLLRILSGHLSPSKGSISFYQGSERLDISDVYRHLSYAAPYIELIEALTLREAIRFQGRFKPLLQNLNTEQLIDLLDLRRARDKQIRNFSSGMKQRVKLGLAICADSDLLLLDEPTSNLDEQGIRWYRDLIQRFSGDRLVIIASNASVDFDFCQERLQVTDFKKRKR